MHAELKGENSFQFMYVLIKLEQTNAANWHLLHQVTNMQKKILSWKNQRGIFHVILIMKISMRSFIHRK